MAARDESLVYRVEGQLCLAPSNLATAFPHGGTALGTIHGVALTPITRSDPITAEEYGGEEVERIRLARDWVCVALMRAYDNDALNLGQFQSTAVGGSSGKRGFSEPATQGAFATANAGVILFSPTDSRKPGFLLRRACPDLEEQARIAFEMVNELNFPLVWRCYRGASGVAVEVKPIADMTL